MDKVQRIDRSNTAPSSRTFRDELITTRLTDNISGIQRRVLSKHVSLSFRLLLITVWDTSIFLSRYHIQAMKTYVPPHILTIFITKFGLIFWLAKNWLSERGTLYTDNVEM
jgi:hypothetical protein